MAIKLNTGTAGTAQTFQPGATFSDQQKQELASSVGLSGEYDPNMFNKEFDPTTGQDKLYIKVGGNKIFGSQPQAKQAGVQEQASYMQNQFGGMTLDDAYSAILASKPSDEDIRVAIGDQTGLSKQIAGVRAQAEDIQRKMLGDQSAIFNAVNPDGTPIDPRIKVAQYQQNMQSYMDRIGQLDKLEATYKANLQTLSEAETNRIAESNKRNLTALQYLKDVNEQKRQEEQVKLQRDQFGFQREQFEYGKQKDIIDFNQAKELAQFNASLDPDKYTKWQEIERTATENSSLADLYGKNVGTYQGNRGYDLAGKIGDAIVAPPGAKVIETRRVNNTGGVDVEKEGEGGMSMKDVGYGNSVVLQLPDGKYMRLSHLQSIDVPLGSQLTGGQLLGTRGNTGNVLGRNGEKLTAEQLAAGRGAHVDVEISNDNTFKGGSLLSNAQQLEYLKGVKPFAKAQTEAQPFTQAEITQFRTYNGNSIPEEYKTKEQKEKFLERFASWQSGGNYTKDQRADISNTFSTLKSMDTFKQYEELRAKSNTLSGIISSLDKGEATPQDKQQLINDFAKILDPTSVVREGEYALAGKYSQSKIQAYGQEIKNFFTTGGPLSDDAAKMLSAGLKKRFDAISKEYDTTLENQLKGLEIRSGISVPPEALGVQYSPLRMQNKEQQKSTVVTSNIPSITPRFGVE